jgi:pimeloyl-ACP methyl ester carboxylesterase
MKLRGGYPSPFALLLFGLVSSLQGCDSGKQSTASSTIRDADDQDSGESEAQDGGTISHDLGPVKDPDQKAAARAGKAHKPVDAETLGRAVVAAIEKSAESERIQDVRDDDWIWIEIDLHDETYPITIDVVASRNAKADHVLYMLPGGSVNFRSSFFTPTDHNLTHFMRERGAVVVGISPREDNVPSTLDDYSFMADWGLKKHRADIRSVVDVVQAVAGLPYDMLGHSYGASCALDYAANDADDLRRLIVLDIYSMVPGTMAPGASPGDDAAELTYQAHVELMRQGVYHDTSYGSTKLAVSLAEQAPGLDSGVSRADAGYPGNFLLEAYLYYSLIYSAPLPGIHTPITGLPGDWLMKQSTLAGAYTLARSPGGDRYSFEHTRIETLREAAAKIGGGLIPVALERDFWAVNAGNPDYVIAFEKIRAEVTWLNTEFGYNEHFYGAQRIAEAGNPHVTTAIIPGYGHADMVWSATAAEDAWSLLPSD